MKFYSFSSSSRGNCYYLSGQSDAVLLDSGISARKIETALAQIDTNTPLRGILLTHEHIDHIKSINTLVKHLQIPVFATKGTWAALEKENCTVPQKLRVDLSGQSSLHLGDLTIRWHNTSHDSLEPVFYTIEENTEKFCPEKIYKDKNFSVDNFPSDIKYADMSGDTPEAKEDLLAKWKY